MMDNIQSNELWMDKIQNHWDFIDSMNEQELDAYLKENRKESKEFFENLERVVVGLKYS